MLLPRTYRLQRHMVVHMRSIRQLLLNRVIMDSMTSNLGMSVRQHAHAPVMCRRCNTNVLILLSG